MTKVLIVDDDARFRRATGIALRSHGYDVVEAASGQEAVSQMQTSPADVILLDWQMPGLDGAGTARAIRECSEVPVIVVSSLDRCRETQEYKLDGNLVKPIGVSTLIRTIELALHRIR